MAPITAPMPAPPPIFSTFAPGMAVALVADSGAFETVGSAVDPDGTEANGEVAGVVEAAAVADVGDAAAEGVPGAG